MGFDQYHERDDEAKAIMHNAQEEEFKHLAMDLKQAEEEAD